MPSHRIVTENRKVACLGRFVKGIERGRPGKGSLTAQFGEQKAKGPKWTAESSLFEEVLHEYVHEEGLGKRRKTCAPTETEEYRVKRMIRKWQSTYSY